MRKDVKLGLTIGGVLLALVVIYLTVLPSGNKSSLTESPPPVVTQTPAPVVSLAEPALAPAAPASQPALTAQAPATAPAASAQGRRDWNLLLNGQPTPPTPRKSAAQMDAGGLFASAGDGSASTQPSEKSTYVVKAGQNYSKISREVYGSAKYYLAIQRANPKLDARKLKPGMVINLPDIAGATASSSSAPAAAPAAEASADSAGQYPVQAGDSLYKIAVKLWGKPSMADKLYEMNKAVIGDDMAKLRVGLVLKLPAAPTQAVQ